MIKLSDLTEPIRDKDINASRDLQHQLENVQGNIFHGHGREHSLYMLLHFKEAGVNAIKHWIKNIAEKEMTSAKQQYDEAKYYRDYRFPGTPFLSLFLSAKGYERLGLGSWADLKKKFDNEAFFCGMEKARYRLNDPPMHTWEDGYRQNDIHAMLLLADDDQRSLLHKARELTLDYKLFEPSVDIRAVEHGQVMRNAQKLPVEHFGYVDSGSQPLFFERDLIRAQQERDGTGIWDPSAGPNLVLVADPFQPAYSGSYVVFRKLEQDVQRFKEQERKLAKALGLSGKDAERVEALIMGRFKDGTPIALQPTAGSPMVPNNFTYEHDPEGRRTPLQSHIRKMNPRDRQNRMRRIVRRGVTYDARQKAPADYSRLETLPATGVGFLFVCYQRNIETQFEFLQAKWANEPRHPRLYGAGIDPIVGQSGSLGAGQQKWPAQWGESRDTHRAFEFHSCVTLMGGEYFFAPSIKFLREMT